jgi:hypothetical protein
MVGSSQYVDILIEWGKSLSCEKPGYWNGAFGT